MMFNTYKNICLGVLPELEETNMEITQGETMIFDSEISKSNENSSEVAREACAVSSLFLSS